MNFFVRKRKMLCQSIVERILNKNKYVVDLIEKKKELKKLEILIYSKMNNNERELELMRERYLKLVDLHGQLQMQNSLLEERVLSIVETYSNEKTQLEQDLINAKQKIMHLQDTVDDLEIEKQRYKDDCNLAVRLLHRYPNEFISTTTTSKIESVRINNRLIFFWDKLKYILAIYAIST